jgi:amidase
MKKPTGRDARLAAAAASAEAPTMLKLENTPMSDIVSALASGRVTATTLTNGYFARMTQFDPMPDRAGIG